MLTWWCINTPCAQVTGGTTMPPPPLRVRGSSTLQTALALSGEVLASTHQQPSPCLAGQPLVNMVVHQHPLRTSRRGTTMAPPPLRGRGSTTLLTALALSGEVPASTHQQRSPCLARFLLPLIYSPRPVWRCSCLYSSTALALSGGAASC